jgi:hypothetical protein
MRMCKEGGCLLDMFDANKASQIGPTSRFVVYAYDPTLKTGGVLNDAGRQVPELTFAHVFTLEEALTLTRMNWQYHTYILHIII